MLFISKWFGVTTNDAERYLDVEQQYAEEIVDRVLLMQKMTATKQNRSLCRGTHAKGICVKARLEVLDVTAGRDAALGARLARGSSPRLVAPAKAYQQLRYWSTVPFRHGPDEFVKQCATPSPANTGRSPQRGSADALRNELVRHVEDDSTMSSFDIGLQFLDTTAMTYAGKRREASFWIENASIEWTESQAPFHTVARLTLLPRSELSPQETAATYFDVTGNAKRDSTPVGSMNRARWRAEAASRQARERSELDRRLTPRPR